MNDYRPSLWSARGLYAWIEYLPRGIRRAWCEITGGHENAPGFARRTDEIIPGVTVTLPTHVNMTCTRCGRVTKWYPTSPKYQGL